MLNVRVFISGQEAEIELGKLPLVFTRRIDNWDKFIGTEGTRAKTLNDVLYLPASKKNTDILAGFGDYDANSIAAQGILPIVVELNGEAIFNGWGQRASTSRNAVHKEGYAIRILGDSVDVMQRLEDVSLRDLDLGTMETTRADILATWTAVDVTDAPTVWQPVIYGGIWEEIFLVFSTSTRQNNYRTGLRPSVRIWRILEAIFERYLGYRIDSSMYESEAFRNQLYLFGVGDDWKRADDITPFQCFVGANTQTFTSSPTNIRFTNSTFPFFNSTPSITPLGFLRPPTNGWYRVEVFVKGTPNISAIKIVAENIPFPGSPTSTFEELASGVVGEIIVLDAVLFEPNRGVTWLRVVAEGTGTMTVENTSTMRAQMIDRFAYGAPLEIASCLHDNPVKDFLLGLQHQYGLVIAVDNANKIVRIDPRFCNYIQSNTIPASNSIRPYYEHLSSAETMRADVSDISLENRRPFGDSLTLSYKEDTADAAYSEIIKQIGDTFAAPLYGQKTEFVAASKKGTTSQNPYFSQAVNALVSQFFDFTTNTFQRLTQWICVADDTEELKSRSAQSYFVPSYTPTRKSTPKTATYYGLLNFEAPALFGKYELGELDTAFIYREFPVAFQVFPDDAGYHAALGGVPYNMSYGTTLYKNSNAVERYCIGLIDRFHRKYLSIIFRDKWYRLRAAVDTTKYLSDYFTVGKMLQVGGSIRKCWQVSTEAFAPLESDVAEFDLVEDADADEEESYTATTNNSVPAIIIGSQLRVADNITGLDPDALFFATVVLAAGGSLTEAQIEVISELFIGLKEDEIWDLYDAIYLMVGGTAAAHKFNAKNPLDTDAAFRLAFAGFWSHSATGALPNGVNAFADTFFTPNINGLADNMGISYWSRTSSAGAYAEMGCNGLGGLAGVGQTYIMPNVSGTNFRAINFNGNQANTGISTKGLFSTNRTNSTSFDFSVDGIVTNTAGHAAILNERSSRKIYIGARNNNGTADLFSNRECIFAAIHKGMTPAQQLAQYNRLLAFQIGFGNRHL